MYIFYMKSVSTADHTTDYETYYFTIVASFNFDTCTPWRWYTFTETCRGSVLTNYKCVMLWILSVFIIEYVNGLCPLCGVLQLIRMIEKW